MLLFVVLNGTISDVLTALLGNEVRVSFGIGTLLIAHVTFCLPYVLFNVSPKLRQMDVRMYEAALDLGCNPRQAFFKVVLPEIMPAIISAFLISLTYSIDDFIISYFNSGTVQTLPIAIYSMTKKRVSPPPEGRRAYEQAPLCQKGRRAGAVRRVPGRAVHARLCRGGGRARLRLYALCR